MSRHVLILGGHGKVSQLLTPLLLKKSWAVTSVIRTEEQVPTIKKLGDSLQGKLSVLVRSLEDVKSESQAKAILDEVKPDYVVWSAGAGGRGGPEKVRTLPASPHTPDKQHHRLARTSTRNTDPPRPQTYAVDRDAAIHFIAASAASPSVTRFLMVSYLHSRRTKPSWWDDEAWAYALKVNNETLPVYYKAKLAADEVLYQESAKKGKDFVGINLRPGLLTTNPAGGVELGKTKKSQGGSSREGVAQVAAKLLEVDGIKNCWVDMLDGPEEIGTAVERIVKEGVDAAEGEDMYQA